jgi:hypothetical protein
MKKLFVFLYAALLCAAVFAQAAPQLQEQTTALPRGYGNITLGMTKEQVQEALKQRPEYGYRGERDVSLIPSTRQTVIETQGRGDSIFARAWFQFHDNKLSVITINLNPAKADRFSVFTALVNKYGQPPFITPQKAEWRNGEVILALESPLTLKYVDAQVFGQLSEQTTAAQSISEQSYKEFLDGL